MEQGSDLGVGEPLAGEPRDLRLPRGELVGDPAGGSVDALPGSQQPPRRGDRAEAALASSPRPQLTIVRFFSGPSLARTAAQRASSLRPSPLRATAVAP